MIVLALVLIVIGAIVFCRLCYSATLLAFPIAVAVCVGKLCWDAHMSLSTAVILAILAGVAAFVIGHLLLALAPHPAIRGGVALLFMIPAGIVGYLIIYEATGLLHVQDWLRIALAGCGGLAAAFSALQKLASLSPTQANPTMAS